MATKWEVIRACERGTEYLRLHADRYLPQQPLELPESWQNRVSRSVFSPYLAKIVRTAVGLILRKPVFLEGGDEAYWETWRQDVCRDGATDLDQFARDVLTQALSYGHCSFLCDFPDTSNVRTLADEREADLKPYLVKTNPYDVIGWRQDPRENMGKLQQVRIKETAAMPKGRFGLEYKNRVRVMEPGSYELWEAKGENGVAGWEVIESGVTSVPDIPLCTVYGDKLGILYSKPPLEQVAWMNISHFQKSSDLTQSLHIAAMPILVGAGMDDLPNDNTYQNSIGLSVNNMVLTGPRSESEVYYVGAPAQCFQEQQQELERLVAEMSELGVAVLTKQNMTSASGVSKQLDRIDSNAVLAVMSKSLQQALQDAVDIAGQYAGVEPPEVTIARDFDVEGMEGGDITAINSLFTSGLLDQKSALEILQHGEVLPDDIDVDEVIMQSDNDELKDLEMQVTRTEAMAEIGEGTPPSDNA